MVKNYQRVVGKASRREWVIGFSPLPRLRIRGGQETQNLHGSWINMDQPLGPTEMGYRWSPKNPTTIC